jgi:hypothetical protein
MSFLAKELQKNAELLQKGAKKHLDDIQDFEKRVLESTDSIKNLFIFKDEQENEKVHQWLKNYFNTEKIHFTAIDGTMFKTSVHDASIFFAGAYESSGEIYCHEKNLDLEVEYSHSYTNKGRGITSVLPLQVTEIVEVDTQFDLDVLHSDHGVQIHEDVLLDQSNIAEYVMLFSEYFLAYKTLQDNSCEQAQILLLDRSISGDHSALIARTQKQVLWEKTVNLIGYKLKNHYEKEYRLLDENDFYWARWFMADHFDPIKPYLKYKILKILLKEQKSLSQNELSDLLQISRSHKNDLATELKFLERKGFIVRNEKLFELNPKYKDSWFIIKKLVLEIGSRLFLYESEEIETKSPFLILKPGKSSELVEKWITTRDLAFLTLFCQYMIIEWLWNNKGMIIGISKDSAARDWRRQLLLIASNQNWIKKISKDVLSLPHTDRSFLQKFSSNSHFNRPWMLIDYDAVYRTITAEGSLVVGTKSNLSGVMKLFAKSYVQLKYTGSNNDLQSHVLAIDRIISKSELLDNNNFKDLQFKKSEKNRFDYPLQTFFPMKNDLFLQKFLLNMLAAMTPNSIPEAFGHNKPLFIADKVAKFYLSEFKRLLVSMGQWLGVSPKLRQDKYTQGSFRENRQEMELNRQEG